MVSFFYEYPKSAFSIPLAVAFSVMTLGRIPTRL
jgi:hypothetical protein